MAVRRSLSALRSTVVSCVNGTTFVNRHVNRSGRVLLVMARPDCYDVVVPLRRSQPLAARAS